MFVWIDPQSTRLVIYALADKVGRVGTWLQSQYLIHETNEMMNSDPNDEYNVSVLMGDR